jgi:hypothetical protein
LIYCAIVIDKGPIWQLLASLHKTVTGPAVVVEKVLAVVKLVVPLKL